MDKLVKDFNTYIETRDNELLAYMLTSKEVRNMIQRQINKFKMYEIDEVITLLYIKLSVKEYYKKAFFSAGALVIFLNQVINSVIVSDLRKKKYLKHEILTNFEYEGDNYADIY